MSSRATTTRPGAVENSGLASIQLPDLVTWVPFELHWSVSGEMTSQAVTLPATADVEWSATGSGAGATTLNCGVIGNEYVRIYARAKTTRAVGNLTQRVSNIVYGYGVDAPSYPTFTAGPAVTSVTSSGGTFTFTAVDADYGDTVTCKYQIVARNAALGSWASAASATSPQSFTGLSAETDYDLVVQATDTTNRSTVSARYQFQTQAAASQAPSFPRSRSSRPARRPPRGSWSSTRCQIQAASRSRTDSR